MFKCQVCNEFFEEPVEELTTYEFYYGVSDLFCNSHDLRITKCPYCESEDYYEVDHYDLDESIVD